MNILDSLKNVLSAIETPEAPEGSYFDYATAATLLRYERITASHTQEVINGHLSAIQDKASARRARDAYTMDYFMNLSIPYQAIQDLCLSMVSRFKMYDVTPTDQQLALAAGKFNWRKEYEDMVRTNGF